MPKVGAPGETTVKVPAGGTAGQVLATAANGGLGWVTPAAASAGPLIPVGGCLDNRLTNTYNCQVSQSLAANVSYYIPVWVWDAMRVDALAVIVNGTNTATFTMGVLVADPGTGLPGTMLGWATFATTVSTAPGVVAVGGPFSTPGGSVSALSVPQGWVYFLFSQTAANPLYGSGVASMVGPPTGMSNASGSTPPQMAAMTGWQANGAVTSSNPAVTATTTISGAPTVFLRKSA